MLSVRQEIAGLRKQADAMEARVNDPARVFSDEGHREHLRHEAARLRSAALSEEQQLARRIAEHSPPTS
jgi:hypothetical protein